MSAESAVKVNRQQFLKMQLPDSTSVMIQSHQLMEVLNIEIQSITSIPDIDSSLLGVYNWRGEVLWLLDAGAYLDSEPLYQNSLGLGKVTVVIIHHQDRNLGLCVKQVNDMVTCSMEGIQDLPNTDLSPRLQACVDGYWLDTTQTVNWILSSQKIIKSLS